MSRRFIEPDVPERIGRFVSRDSPNQHHRRVYIPGGREPRCLCKRNVRPPTLGILKPTLLYFTRTHGQRISQRVEILRPSVKHRETRHTAASRHENYRTLNDLSLIISTPTRDTVVDRRRTRLTMRVYLARSRPKPPRVRSSLGYTEPSLSTWTVAVYDRREERDVKKTKYRAEADHW